MALSRYARPDPYTLEELRRKYQGCDCGGRIRLLRRLSRKAGIPSQIAELAVRDEHAQVRQWIARFESLYGEQAEQLKKDPDEFVRACCWENPSRELCHEPDACQKAFETASHLERLAMVRNPVINNQLIEKILDTDNQEFGLDMEARGQLASAFLTNERAMDRGQISFKEWNRRFGTDDASGFVHQSRTARDHYDKIWALASKWPSWDIELGVRYWVYRYVGAGDKTKAETYRACEVPALRRGILRNTRPPVDTYDIVDLDPSNSETTKLGLQDDDDECRRIAAGRAGTAPENKKLKYVSYAKSVLWAAVPNAVAIAFALKILASASTSFETSVLAILVIIYSGATWTSTSHGMAISGQAVIGTRRYLRIIELLKDPLYTEESKESFEEPLRKQEEANGVILISQSLWSMALMAIALFYLFRSIV